MEQTGVKHTLGGIRILYPQADGSFTPDQLVTNEQFLVALARYANAEGFSTKVYFNMSTISGSADIHDWAMDACKWAAKMNILILDEDGYFLPGRTIIQREGCQTFFPIQCVGEQFKKIKYCFRACLISPRTRLFGGFSAIPRCFDLKYTKYSCIKAPCLTKNPLENPYTPRY